MATKNHVSGIYSITNLSNGKRYIGQSKSLNCRWRQHKSDLKHKRHKNPHLQNAYDAYGLDSFVFEILEECPLDHRDDRERYWIDFHQTMNKEYGYNSESGGNGKKTVSAETRKKMSEIARNRTYSAETRRKMSIASKASRKPGWKPSEESVLKMIATKRSKPNPLKGVPRTDEVKAKLSAAKKGKPTWNKGKHLTQEWKDKIGAYHKGKVMSEESRLKMSESKKAKATPEMMADIQAGMMRKDFAAKYGNKRLWTRIKNEQKQS